MNTAFHLLETLSVKLNRLSEILLGIIGSVLILIVSIGIIFRYIFRLPLTWSYELSVVCFIWVSFQGAAYALGKGSHVSFDFLLKLFPKAYYFRIETIKYLLLSVILFVGCMFGTFVFLNMAPQRYQTIPISLGWLYLALPVGFLFMLIHTLYHLVRHLNGNQTTKKEG
ncbi:MAG: TRAP transporter small permease [Spirochaetes bacterium]|nr:TRAP transporter small permease [Spirochaetota bacterium]